MCISFSLQAIESECKLDREMLGSLSLQSWQELVRAVRGLFATRALGTEGATAARV